MAEVSLPSVTGTAGIPAQPSHPQVQPAQVKIEPAPAAATSFSQDQLQETTKGGVAPLVSLVQTHPGIQYAELLKSANVGDKQIAIYQEVTQAEFVQDAAAAQAEKDLADAATNVLSQVLQPMWDQWGVAQTSLQQADKQKLDQLQASMQDFGKSTFAQKVSAGFLENNASKNKVYGSYDLTVCQMIRHCNNPGDIEHLRVILDKISQKQPLTFEDKKNLEFFGLVWDKNALFANTLDPTQQGDKQFVSVLIDSSQLKNLIQQVNLINNASPTLRTYLKQQADLMVANGDLEKLQRSKMHTLQMIAETEKMLDQQNAETKRLQSQVKSTTSGLKEYLVWGQKYVQALNELRDALATAPPQWQKLSPMAMGLLDSLGYQIDTKQNKIVLDGVEKTPQELYIHFYDRTQELKQRISSSEQELNQLREALLKSSTRQTELLQELDVLEAQRSQGEQALEDAQKKQAQKQQQVTKAYEQLPSSEQSAQRENYEKVKQQGQEISQKTQDIQTLSRSYGNRYKRLKTETLDLIAQSSKIQKNILDNLKNILPLRKGLGKLLKSLFDSMESLDALVMGKTHKSKAKPTLILAQTPLAQRSLPKKSSGLKTDWTQAQLEAEQLLQQDKQKQQATQALEAKMQTQEYRKAQNTKERDNQLQAERQEKIQKLEQILKNRP